MLFMFHNHAQLVSWMILMTIYVLLEKNENLLFKWIRSISYGGSVVEWLLRQTSNYFKGSLAAWRERSHLRWNKHISSKCKKLNRGHLYTSYVPVSCDKCYIYIFAFLVIWHQHDGFFETDPNITRKVMNWWYASAEKHAETYCGVFFPEIEPNEKDCLTTFLQHFKMLFHGVKETYMIHDGCWKGREKEFNTFVSMKEDLFRTTVKLLIWLKWYGNWYTLRSWQKGSLYL